MRTLTPQSQHPPTGWAPVGLVADRLPVATVPYERRELPPARIPAIEPSEDRDIGLGAQGQPEHAPLASGFDPIRQDPRAGMPILPESTLIQAHRRCSCCQTGEQMPWEQWSEGQWEWYRRRQRVMARRAIQREQRAQKAGPA